VVLGASALALALAVVVPHHHDATSASHHGQPCRACKIHDGFSAAPASAVEIPRPYIEAVRSLRPGVAAPRL